jgi:hypothetical protein
MTVAPAITNATTQAIRAILGNQKTPAKNSLIGKAVTQSHGIEDSTPGADIRHVGIMLDNTLRQQSQPPFEGKRVCVTFRQHVGRFPDLAEVGFHELFRGSMQLPELQIVHLPAPRTRFERFVAARFLPVDECAFHIQRFVAVLAVLLRRASKEVERFGRHAFKLIQVPASADNTDNVIHKILLFK